MLRKRFIIEIVLDQLKNISQIEYSRHLNCISVMVNLLAGLIAYSFQPKKPSFKMTRFNKQVLIQISGYLV
uniref:transposase n=1 Tax=Candidatus Enterovibrio escicola TaxID=1927127 RepID=UPI0018F12E10|nr:transposase [Candidatus Enterovibrio escacola]